MASPGNTQQITRLLVAYSEGNRDALDRLVPLVYEPLRKIAHARVRREYAGRTLCTTGLVHEAYLKLVDVGDVAWKNRGHFYAICSRLMRQILVDNARRRNAAKRGGDAVMMPLDEAHLMPDEQADHLLLLDDALDRLAQEDERAAEALSHRYFAGLTNEEIAQALGVSVPTVERDLRFARAWLARFLRDDTSPNGDAT